MNREVTFDESLKIAMIARACHEANHAYSVAAGDFTTVPYSEASPDQIKSATSGVVAVLREPDITPEALHDRWCEYKRAAGWRFGETKDETNRTHPCLVPYGELPTFQRAKDELFRTVALAMAKALGVSLA